MHRDAGRWVLALLTGVALLGREISAQTAAPAAVPPAPPAASLIPFIGEYAVAGDTVIVAEVGGRLLAYRGAQYQVVTAADFVRDRSGRPTTLGIDPTGFPRTRVGTKGYPRIAVGTDEGVTFRVKPLLPIDELRRNALAATPPAESGKRTADLVELVTLDSTIKLDIRYASTDNFMGAPMYSSARAFLQRPAAEAVVRVHRALKAMGFGLMIHDAYRPWYVTRMFWDATTGADHGFVADPAKGSRHNRGAAVDLTLYTLADGKAVRMPGGYDEFSHRSFPAYPGGSSLERWRREVLRTAMEREGFTVNESEWWHFDFGSWQAWPLGNAPFEVLGTKR
jgi:D-alanyl-D-alanine dipeptidase